MVPIDLKILVSEKTMRMLQAGKAFLGPGGVRLPNGQFVELYKLLGPSLSNTNMMISAINPVSFATDAAGLISQSANMVLSYQNGKKLNTIINTLSKLQGITWATTALGAANMALTAMSFAVINSKLDGISNQITYAIADLKREMKAIQLEEKSVEILTLIGNLKSASHYLSINSLGRQDEMQIEGYLNGARQLIVWLKDRFEKAEPKESGTLFSLLFDLTSFYSAVLKEYSTQYFYLEDCFPGNYSVWLEAFSYADSKDVHSSLKRTIWLANPIETTEKLEAAYDFTLNTVHLQLQDLNDAKEIIPQVPHEVVVDFDNYVKRKIDSGDVDIVEKALDEDPRERVLLRSNGFMCA